MYNSLLGKVDISETDWKTDIKNWSVIEIDELKFVFYQAEKQFDDILKSFEGTTNKSTSLITLVSGLVVTQAAYFFINLDIKGIFDYKLCTVFISCMYSIILLRYIMNNILPTKLYSIGSDPKDLFTRKFFDESLGKEKLKYLYANEIENYSKRINYNNSLNSARLSRFRRSIILLVCQPIVCLFFYLFIAIIAPRFGFFDKLSCINSWSFQVSLNNLCLLL